MNFCLKHKCRIYMICGFLMIIFTSQLSAQDPLYTKDRNLPCINRTFFTYVHIVKDSLGKPVATESEVKQILERANKAFEPICLSFDFCAVNYIEDYSFAHINSGVEIGLLTSRFHKERRINIYVVNSVISNNVNSFSFHNTIAVPDSAVVIIPSTGIGIEHELGHVFGLYHTFHSEFGIELANGTNCATAGDLLCDTPADPNVVLINGCIFNFDGKDSNDDYYRTEIGNFMTHYFCAHCFFTTGQYEKMAKTYLESEFKMW